MVLCNYATYTCICCAVLFVYIDFVYIDEVIFSSCLLSLIFMTVTRITCNISTSTWNVTDFPEWNNMHIWKINSVYKCSIFRLIKNTLICWMCVQLLNNFANHESTLGITFIFTKNARSQCNTHLNCPSNKNIAQVIRTR